SGSIPAKSSGLSSTSGTTPQLIRFVRWIRANDLTMTARTPRYIGPVAAASRDEPWPYVSPPTMMDRPAALARARKAASTYVKQNSEIAGMFERNTRTAEPAGEMSSVDTLSPSLITTGASSVSATGSPRGTGLMFGPRGISPAPSGWTNPTVELAKRAGRLTGAGAPSVRGSGQTPVGAEA